MAGKGGYQAPAHPAAVSGPGSLSQRTDGQAAQFSVPDQAYGDNKELAIQQSGAPMARSAPQPGPAGQAPSASGGSSAAALLGLDADSQRPDEPVTAGVDRGEGPGSEILPTTTQVQPPTGELTQLIFNLSASDRTGPLAALGMEAMRRGL